MLSLLVNGATWTDMRVNDGQDSALASDRAVERQSDRPAAGRVAQYRQEVPQGEVTAPRYKGWPMRLPVMGHGMMPNALDEFGQTIGGTLWIQEEVLVTCDSAHTPSRNWRTRLRECESSHLRSRPSQRRKQRLPRLHRTVNFVMLLLEIQHRPRTGDARRTAQF